MAGAWGAADDSRKELDVDRVDQARPKERTVENAARVGDDAAHAEDLTQPVKRLAQINVAVADLEVRHIVLAEELAVRRRCRARYQDGQLGVVLLEGGPSDPGPAVNHDEPPPEMSVQILRQEVTRRDIGFGVIVEDCFQRLSRGKGVAALEGDASTVKRQDIHPSEPVEWFPSRIEPRRRRSGYTDTAIDGSDVKGNETQ
jgi:hypothetical protein